MAVRIQLRNDTAANWTDADPVLAAGELGLETDTVQFKIGDGTSSWTELGYGISGPTGPIGPSGGPTGPAGPAGTAGTAATVAVGTVSSTGPTGTATVTNSGTSSAAVFDFVLRQGATGVAGTSGVISVTGPITNSGSPTSANLGFDETGFAKLSGATFTGPIGGAPAEPDANANTAKNLGYIGMPQVLLSAGNLTLSKTHAGEHIYIIGVGQTITIPSNASVPFEIGTTTVIINANLTSTIAITSDTLRLAGTETTGTRTLAANGMATLVKIAPTTWIISGVGVS
jgi:hypothetical protein